MRAMDAPDDAVEAAQARIDSARERPADDPDEFLVEADIWPTVLLFLELQCQWEMSFAPDGRLVRTALPADRVAAYLGMTVPRRRHRQLAQELAVMAQAALAADAELRTKRAETQQGS